uniref:Zinc finger protein 367 n=1 Tax=Aceria tosichella TaxID=561515 RepID=A0A6G1SEH7_9ACAR
MENAQRRGRPKLEEISSLIKEGAQSKSPIRCRFCKRAFPREKSLQAHLRTHTGERPYRCTHPGCHKSFVQSGQLRTHLRLHTGEKPFRCNECKNRFTHANRRCPKHPNAGVTRDEMPLRAPLTNYDNLSYLTRDEIFTALALIELSRCH